MVVIKLLALALFVGVGATHINPANYTPFAPNGFTRHPPGRGDRVLRLHRLRRDLDRGGGDEEPAAQPADRHPRRPGHLHGHLRHRRRRADRAWCRTSSSRVADPLARALELAGFTTVGWIVALGAVVSMSAVLLVFQYGQPRIFFAMARDGLLPQWAAHARSEDAQCRTTTTLITGVFVARGSLDRRRRRDLRPHQHRHAVRVRARLHRRAGAARTRSPIVRGRSACRSSGRSARCSARRRACSSCTACRGTAWERFGIWLAIGLVLYFAYGYRHSKLRAGAHGPL